MDHRRINNPLLQTFNYGLDDHMKLPNLVPPVKKREEPVVAEIDNFIGQESSSATSLDDFSAQSTTPLLVPSSSSVPVVVGSSETANLSFIPSFSDSPGKTSGHRPPPPPPSSSPSPSLPPQGGGHNYRRGNFKRPAYAHIPGLNSSVAVGTPNLFGEDSNSGIFHVFTPTQHPQPESTKPELLQGQREGVEERQKDHQGFASSVLNAASSILSSVKPVSPSKSSPAASAASIPTSSATFPTSSTPASPPPTPASAPPQSPTSAPPQSPSFPISTSSSQASLFSAATSTRQSAANLFAEDPVSSADFFQHPSASNQAAPKPAINTFKSPTEPPKPRTESYEPPPPLELYKTSELFKPSSSSSAIFDTPPVQSQFFWHFQPTPLFEAPTATQATTQTRSNPAFDHFNDQQQNKSPSPSPSSYSGQEFRSVFQQQQPSSEEITACLSRIRGKSPPFSPASVFRSDAVDSGNWNNNNNNNKDKEERDFSEDMASVSGRSTRLHSISTYTGSGTLYRAGYHHWFYKVDLENRWFYQNVPDTKCVWKPFSMNDSLALESAFSLPSLNEHTKVATDGGRYDVYIERREKKAVYWEDDTTVVRRCSWFSRGPADASYVPYGEDTSVKLEEEYKKGMMTGLWNRKVDVGNDEEVIMYSPSSMNHQPKVVKMTVDVACDSNNVMKPRMVKRGGFDDFDISDGEPEKVDHLMFLIHGIGQFCDLKFRSIIEVVDEFRNISLQLTQSHFQESCEIGEVNRIEILPISWHKTLHCDEIDLRLKNITLPSIPRLRDFANDTILDILFYTSPVFCQVIIDTVASELNRIYDLFKKRNPDFKGKVSLGGHSLGSLIVFDLLSNQPTTPLNFNAQQNNCDNDLDAMNDMVASLGRKMSFVTIGKEGTGQPFVKYPRLDFHPRFFFAFGSPIAGFLATRSNEILGENFKFPTCEGFFNIFHPYDPIAYRVEPFVIPSLSKVKPVQIPHHKGRKRMHLELKDTVSHVGQRLFDTLKSTWNMVYHLAVNKSVDAAESAIHEEVNRVLQRDVVLQTPLNLNPNLMPVEPVLESTDARVGNLNQGRRIDYVLQEAPVEYFNEYIFALASHLCYWTSRDTMLMVLKEIYGDMNICCDSQIPQNILPFDIAPAGEEGQGSGGGGNGNGNGSGSGSGSRQPFKTNDDFGNIPE